MPLLTWVAGGKRCQVIHFASDGQPAAFRGVVLCHLCQSDARGAIRGSHRGSWLLGGGQNRGGSWLQSGCGCRGGDINQFGSCLSGESSGGEVSASLQPLTGERKGHGMGGRGSSRQWVGRKAGEPAAGGGPWRRPHCGPSHQCNRPPAVQCIITRLCCHEERGQKGQQKAASGSAHVGDFLLRSQRVLPLCAAATMCWQSAAAAARAALNASHGC